MHDVGPGLALLMLVLVPLVYSLPEILVVGELASMLPEEGGYYRWVRRAFGPFWAFQNGWLTWRHWCSCAGASPRCAVRFASPSVPGASPSSPSFPCWCCCWLLVVALSVVSGEYGVPAVIGATAVVALGPLAFSLAQRHKTPGR